MRKAIENLIKAMNDDQITAYKVFKETGVSQFQLSNLKNGKAQIGNIKFETAENLSNYYEEWYKMNMINYVVRYDEYSNNAVTTFEELWEVDKQEFEKYLEYEDFGIEELMRNGKLQLDDEQHDKLVEQEYYGTPPKMISKIAEGFGETGTDMDGNYQTGMGN